jgi:excisionase family DNA binding protein
MSLTLYQADRRRMKAYICSRILNEEDADVLLADGDDGELRVFLYPIWDEQDGWDLFWETDCPEAVDLRDIYQHFRGREMTWWEWWVEFEGEMARSKVRSWESEAAVLHRADSSEPVTASGEPLLPQALTRIQVQLTEIITKLDELEDLRERMSLQDDDPSFTVHQVAQKLQVSPTKVYQLTESGKLKSYKTGNQVRIKASHIREYQTRHTKSVVDTKRRRSGSFNKSEADRMFGPGWDS